MESTRDFVMAIDFTGTGSYSEKVAPGNPESGAGLNTSLGGLGSLTQGDTLGCRAWI